MNGGEIWNVTIDGARLRRRLFGVFSWRMRALSAVLAMLRLALRVVCAHRFKVDIDVKLSPTPSTDRFLEKVTITSMVTGVVAVCALFSTACATTTASAPASSSATEHHAPRYTEEARASAPKPEVIAFQVPLEATRQVAALSGPVSNVPAFTFPCTTSAARIKPPTSGAGAGSGAGYVAIQVWNNSATPVYFGDSTVDSTGWPLCTNTSLCPTASKQYEVRNLDCLASAGTVTINAQVAQP